MRYAAINYMGDTPATSYQNSKLICLNADVFFLYPAQIRKFIALHEKGHIVLNTDSEIEADNYAFKKFNGSLPSSHRWSVLAMSRVLPFSNKEQYMRLLNMYKQALIADQYETGASISYEMSEINMLLEEMDNMNDQEWRARSTIDPITGEESPFQQHNEPVGEFVAIAREVWTKAILGDDLNGYELTILDKYPIPADFEAYPIDEKQIIDDNGSGNELSDLLPSITDELFPKMEVEKATKMPSWIWLIIIGFVLLLIFKR